MGTKYTSMTYVCGITTHFTSVIQVKTDSNKSKNVRNTEVNTQKNVIFTKK